VICQVLYLPYRQACPGVENDRRTVCTRGLGDGSGRRQYLHIVDNGTMTAQLDVDEVFYVYELTLVQWVQI